MKFRRLTALLLAFIMVVSSGVNGYAAENESGDNSSGVETVDPADTTDGAGEDSVEEKSPEPADSSEAVEESAGDKADGEAGKDNPGDKANDEAGGGADAEPGEDGKSGENAPEGLKSENADDAKGNDADLSSADNKKGDGAAKGDADAPASDEGEGADGLLRDGERTTYAAKIGETNYESFEDAVAAANGQSGAVTIELLADVTWTTGASHGSTPLLTADSAVTTLTINGNDHTFTAVGQGIGSLRAANNGKLIFNNLTIKDESKSYAEDSWEHGYLEFGGILEFNNVDFVNAVMLTADNGQQPVCNATFTNCKFNSNNADQYDVWVSQGDATFTNCTFTGYRGAKTHEAYGSEVGTITFTECEFKGLSVKPGLAVGTVNANTTVIFDSCTFDNVQAGKQGLYILETDPATSVYNLVFKGTATVDGAEALAARIGNIGYLTVPEAFAAVKAGETLEILKAGEYTLPSPLANITVQGKVDGVRINATGAEKTSVCSIPNGATFKNLAFNFGNVNYHGFQHAGTINMEGCTINGKFFSYGEMNFTGCTFNAPGTEASGISGSDYSMWAYAGNLTYANCKFNGAGKFLHAYNEDGTKRYNVDVTNCTFNNIGDADKSAINVKETCGAKTLQYTVNINSCTTTGNFPSASESDSLTVISGLAQVDKRVAGGTENGGEIIVNVDGPEAYRTPEKSLVIVSIEPAEETYDGVVKTPVVKVKYGTDAADTDLLTEGTDYSVSWKPAELKNAGTYTVTVTGKGTYEGKSATAEFTIKAVNMRNFFSGVEASNSTYTGFPQVPTFVFRDSENEPFTVTEDNYDLTPANKTDSGTYTVQIKGKGNFFGTDTTVWAIDPADFSNVVVTISPESYVFGNDTAYEPTVTATLTTGEQTYTLVKGTDYTVSYSNNTAAGTAVVTVTPAGSNFTGTPVEKTFAIKALSVAVSDDVTFTGSKQEPTLTVKLDGDAIAPDSYTVVWNDSSFVNAGTYTATVTCDGVSKTAEYTINKADISTAKNLTIPTASKTFAIQNGGPFEPAINANAYIGASASKGYKLVAGVDYDVTYSNNNAVGTATATVTPKGNFTGDPITLEFSIIDGVASITKDDATTYYTTITSALSAAVTGDTVVLLTDVTSGAPSSATAQLTAAKSITLDLNGHSVKHTNGKNAFYITGSSGKVPNLTITGTGTIESNAAAIRAGANAVVTIDSGVTVIGGTYGVDVNGGNTTLNTVGIITGDTAGIFVAGAGTSNANKIVNINGGTVSGEYGIYSNQASTVNIIDGTITGKNAAVALNGYQAYSETSPYTIKLNVTGGEIKGTGEGAAIAASGNEGSGNYEINISDGTITSDDVAIYHCNDGVLTISGGTITGATAVYQKSGTLSITGGTMNATGGKADYEFNGNGANATGDALVVDNCDYPGGAPVANISGGTFNSANAKEVASYYGNGINDLADVRSTSNTITVPDNEMWLADEGGYKLVKAVMVTFDSNGGGTIEPQKVEPGTAVAKPDAPIREGYVFDGWFAEDSETAFDFTTLITENITLTAHWAEAVAKIGDKLYATLVDAFAEAQSGDIVEVFAGTVELPTTAVIPEGVTIKGAGTDKTTLKITTSNGDGVKLTNSNVTIQDVALDGSAITSGGYKSLINVEADGCTIDNVVFSGGGRSTWNSSILVEKLTADQTFTVKNSTVTGSFRGILRESCSANIVIDNCDIDAVYPFNIDGGNSGIITVTGTKLHGWTSYSGVEKVTFTNCEFSKGNSGYDCIAAYVDTEFNDCTFDSTFDVYAQTSPFTFTFNDCVKAGENVIRDEFMTQFPEDPDVWNKCDTYVNGKLVGAVAEVVGDKEYKSLQAALNAAHEMTGDVTVTLLADITEVALIHQKAGLNLTVDGDGKKIAGQTIIDGDGRANGTETLTIKNIEFEGNKSNLYSGTESFILVPSTKDTGKIYTTGKYNYAHNITISDCSFTSTSTGLDVVGYKATSGAGDYNVALNNITGTNLHSLAQLTGTTGGSFTNCNITASDSFVNISGGTGEFTFTGNTFVSAVSDGYGVRLKDSTTATAILGEGNNITAATALVLGKNAETGNQGTIKVTDGYYAGDIKKITTSENAKFDITGGFFTVAPAVEFCGKDTDGNQLYPIASGKADYLYTVGEAVAQIGSVKYESLEEAFAAAADGDTIELLKNTSGNGIIAPQGKFAEGLTVDFKEFTYDFRGKGVGSTGTEYNGFQLLMGNTITFKNGTITATSEDAGFLIQNYSNLTLDNMEIDGTGVWGGYVMSNNNGNVVIKDTAINAKSGDFAFDVCRYSSYPSVSVTVEGASVINGNIEVSASGNDPKDGAKLLLKGETAVNGNLQLADDLQTPIGARTIEITKDDTISLAAPADYKWVPNNDGTSTLTPKDYVAQIGDEKYESLEEAVAAAQDGEAITVLKDCSGNGIQVPQGKFTTGLTVDFAGHTYTMDGTMVGSTGTQTQAFQLLKDNKITFKNGTITSEKAKMLVQNYSDLTLDGMTLTLDNKTYTSAYTLSNNNGEIVIKDSTINANPAGGFAFDVCRYSSYPSVSVTVEGESVINGNIEVSASNNEAKEGFGLTVSGGTINGELVIDASAAALIGTTPEKAEITKNNDVVLEAPKDFKWRDNGDGTSTLIPKDYVAQISDEKYESLEEAVAAAQNGDTITVLKDCSGNGIQVPQGKFTTGLTVDFAGHTYTMDGTMVGSTGTQTQAFQLLKDNKITFQNGTITSEKAKMLVQNYSDLTLDGMTLTLDNKTYTSAYTLSNNNGEIVIKDSTINANPAGGFAFDVCRYSSYPSVNVSVEGESVINGNIEVSASGSDAKEGFGLTVSGGTINGKLVLDASAATPIRTTPEKAEITKANDVVLEAPKDFKWRDNGDGTSTLIPKDYVAQIGDEKYESLEEAVAAAEDGDTITVLKDCSGNGIKVPQGKFTTGLTVDFDGHTYDFSGTGVGSTGTEYNGFQLLTDNTITFKNGTLTASSEDAGFLVQNYSNLTLDNMTVDGSKVWGGYAMSNNNGKVVINNSTITAPAGGFAFDVCRYSSYPSVNVTVEGESVINGNIEVSASGSDAKEGFALTVSGGTINGKLVLDASAATPIRTTPEKAEITKANDVVLEAPKDFKWRDNGDGTSTLIPKDYVAQIGDVKYESLEEAVAAAQNGDTITVLKDCSGNGIQVPQGKFTTGLTVDFASHTYTMDGTMVGSTGTQTQAFQLLKDNKITFQNGTITSEKAKMLVQNYSDLTLDGMTLTLDNKTYTSAYTLSNNNGEIVIKDSTINANPAGGFAFDVCRYSSYPSVNVTVEGESVINGNIEVSASGSNAKNGFGLMLNGGTLNGAIVMDASAKNVMINDPDKISITKVTDLIAAIPEDYAWVDESEGIQKLYLKATVTYDVDGTKTVKEAFLHKETPLVDDPAKENYVFNGWISSVTGETTMTVPETVEALAITYVATWKGVVKQVIYTDGFGNVLQENEVEYGQPTPAFEGSLEGITKEGFEFDPADPWTPAVKTTVDEDIVYVINWNKIKFTVTFNTDGGSKTPAQTVDYGDKALEPTTIKEGYTFTGWYDENDQLFDFETAIKEDITLKAKWFENVAKIGDTYYPTLVEAVAAAQSSETVELLKDFSGAGVFLGTADAKSITIDLGGHTYTVSGPAVGSTGTQSQALHLEKGNAVVLKNGTVTSTANSGVSMLVQNYCNLTLEDVTLDGSKMPGTGNYAMSNNSGNVVIGNGTHIIANDGSYAFDVCATNYYPDGVTVTVEDGAVIDGDVQYDVWGTKPADNKAKLVVNGGTFNGTFDVETALAEDAKTNLTITGGAFADDSGNSLNIPEGQKLFQDDDSYYRLHNAYVVKIDPANEAAVTELTVKEGDVIEQPEDPTPAEGYHFTGWYLDEEEYVFTEPVMTDLTIIAKYEVNTYKVTFDADGGSEVPAQTVDYGDKALEPTTVKEGYTFTGWYDANDQLFDFDTAIKEDISLKAQWFENVAKIGDTYYPTLVEAVAAAQSGETVELLKDFSGAGVFLGTADAKDITIDLGGHTYTVSGPAVGSAGTQSQALHLEKGNAVVLKNGTVTSTANSGVSMLVQNYCNLTLEDVTLDGSSLPGSKPYTMSNNCGNVVIGNGTHIIAKEGGYAFDVCATNYYPDGVTVTVEEGAVIDGDVQYDVWGTKPADNKAKLVVNGGTFNGTFDVEAALAEDAETNLTITGGAFADDTGNNLNIPEGQKLFQDEDGYYRLHNAYVVKIDPANDEAVTELTVKEGDTIEQLEDPTPAEGYHFTGWYRDEEAYVFTEPVMTDLTIIAKYEINTYSVTFDTDGGSEVPAQTVNYGDKALEPTTVKEGYTFTGWYDENDQLFDFETAIKEDITLKAKWFENVAKIGDTYYPTLVEAVAEAQSGDTVELLKDFSGAGIFLGTADAKDITIDLGGHTYTVSGPAVGSTGTQSQAFHLEKGNAVTLKNGTVTSTADSGVFMLIQNYCDLTLEDVTLDGSKMPGTGNYAMSNNSGNVVIGNGTHIIANDGSYAFDVCATNYYPDGVTVTVEDGAVIDGDVQYDVWGTKPADNKAKLVVNGGTFNGTFDVEAALAEDAKTNLTINGGAFADDKGNEYDIPEDKILAKLGDETMYTLHDAVYVTFDADNTDGTDDVTKVKIVKGAKIEQPEDPTPAAEGYHFIGWYLDEEAYVFTEPVMTDLTIIAKYEINTYSVTFDTDGGSEVPAQTVNYGDKATKPADPEKEGYNFTGWYLDEEPYSFENPVKEDLELKATWEIKKFTVTFKNDDGTQLQSGEADYGTTPAYSGETPKKAEDAQYTYIFAGWTPEITTVTGDAEYTARYTTTPRPYTITWVIDGASIPARYDYNADIVVPDDPVKSGYTFTGWSVVGTGTTEYTEVPATMPAENLTITAEFERSEFTVTFDTDGGSEAPVQIVNRGDKAVEPTTTKEGYTFTGWYDANDQLFDFDTAIKEDITLKAQWFENVAKIGDTYYPTLVEAVAAAQSGDTVELLKDFSGAGIFLSAADAKSITIDLGGHTYTVSGPAVGSAGTQSQALHLEKGNAVTVKNGTVTSTANSGVSMLVQNYCNLTLEDVTLDGSSLSGTKPYTMSNNCGNVVIGNGTHIIAKEGGYAFDVCATNYYPDGVTVTVEEGAVIDGDVQYDVWGTKPADNKAKLVVNGGTFNGTFDVEDALAEDAETNLTITGGAFADDSGNSLNIPEGKRLFKDEDGYYRLYNAYAVSIDPANGGTVTELTVREGDTIEKPEDPTPAAEGYHFTGWYLDEEEYVFTEPVMTDLTIIAKYAINTYKVTFDAGNIPEQNVEHGDKATKPADPEKEGYNFTGWYLDEEPYDFENPVTDSIELKAKWEIKKFTVTFRNYDETELQSGEAEYGSTPEYSGETPKREADAEYTYIFAGWTPEITTVTDNAEYTARYTTTPKPYTITWIIDGVSIPARYDYNADVIKPADPVKDGFTFTGWSVVGTGTTEYTEVPATMPAENLTITAEFKRSEFTITFDTDGGTAIDPITVIVGDDITVPAETTKEGYTFTGWSVTGDVSGEFDSIPAKMPEENLTFKAEWSINQYTITFNTNGAAEIAPITQNYGTSVTAPADPEREGYRFLGWDKDIPETMPAENLTITAEWEEIYLTVQFEGTMSPVASQRVKYKEKAAEPEAPVVEGYRFLGWFVGDDLYDFDTPVTANLTLNAKFVKQYKITFVDSDNTTVLQETAEYDEGIKASEIAVPTVQNKTMDEQYEYVFSGWSPAVADVTADQTYTAQYTKTVRKYTVTFVDADGTTELSKEEVLYGSQATVPDVTPTKQYCEFNAWYLEGKAFDFATEITGNVTLTANYKTSLLRTAAVNFEGRIQIRFMFELLDSVMEADGAYVVFEKADGTEIRRTLITDGEENGDRMGYYCPVIIKEFADDIIVKLVDKDGNAIPCFTTSGIDTTNGYAYSAKAYAERTMKNSSNPAMRELAKAFYDYGVAAQIFFQYGEYSSLTVSEDVTNVTVDMMGEATDTSGTKPAGVKVSINGDFEADNSLYIFYTLPSGKTPSDYTFMVDGQEAEPVYDGSRYYVRVGNIAAKDLADRHVFTISDGKDTFTVNASLISYAKGKAGNGTDQMKNLAKALYLYNEKAAAYFGN